MNPVESVLADRCVVVLVRPAIAGNVGAVARVMANFGLGDLRLVQPHVDPLDREARRLSAGGEALLHRCRCFAKVGDAVADCVRVAATTARVGGRLRAPARWPHQACRDLYSSTGSGRVALVFGPESSGLTNAELTRCQELIHIPTSSTYAALNLSHAVAVCVYEMRLAALETELPPTQRAIADHAQLERMFDLLEQGLAAVHFLWGDNAEALMHGLRRLIARAEPSAQEVQLLLGLARQLMWFANHHGDAANDSAQ